MKKDIRGVLKRNIREIFAAAAIAVFAFVPSLMGKGKLAEKAEATVTPSQDTTLQTQAPKQEVPEIIEALMGEVNPAAAMQAMTDDAKAEMAEAAAAMRTEIIPLSQKITEKDLIARGVSPYDAPYVIRSIKTIIKRAGKVRDGDVLVFQDGTLAIKKTGWNRGAAYPLYGEIKESVKVAEVSVAKAEAVKAEKAEEAKAKAEAVKAEKAKKVEEARAKAEAVKAEKAKKVEEARAKAEAVKAEQAKKVEEARAKAEAVKAEQAKRDEVIKASVEKQKPSPAAPVKIAPSPVVTQKITTSAPLSGSLEDKVAQDFLTDGRTVRMVALRQGQTLPDLMDRAGVSSEQRRGAIMAFNAKYSASNLLRPGDSFGLIHDANGEFDGLFFIDKKAGTVVSVERTVDAKTKANIFKGKVQDLPVKSVRALISGKITPSQNLYQSLIREGASKATAMNIVELLSERLDYTKMLPEDSFKIIKEDRTLANGKTVADGEPVYIQVKSRGQTTEIFRVTYLDGKISDYVDADGVALNSVFRRPNGRMSSPFSLNRFNPVLGYSRAHRGIDYAAPLGTPIPAAADGRIVFSGWQGGYGNVVIVDHGGGVETVYAHARKPSHLRIGTMVKRDQTIAETGSTGYSTGPHVHFEVRLNGVQVNPEELLVRETLTGEKGRSFAAQKDTMRKECAALEQSKIAAAIKSAVVNNSSESTLLGLIWDRALSAAHMRGEAELVKMREEVAAYVPPGALPEPNASGTFWNRLNQDEAEGVRYGDAQPRSEDVAVTSADILKERDEILSAGTSTGWTLGGIHLQGEPSLNAKVANSMETNEKIAASVPGKPKSPQSRIRGPNRYNKVKSSKAKKAPVSVPVAPTVSPASSGGSAARLWFGF